MATANNIPSQEEASHPRIGEESGRGRLFRRRHICTAGEALQPSAVSHDEEFPRLEGWDAKKEEAAQNPRHTSVSECTEKAFLYPLNLGGTKRPFLYIHSHSCVADFGPLLPSSRPTPPILGTPRHGKQLTAGGPRQPYKCGDDGIIYPFRTPLRCGDDWLPLGSECCWLSPSVSYSSIRFSFPPHTPSFHSIIILLSPQSY